jgi:hypothetical protein
MENIQKLESEFDRLISEPADEILIISRCIGASHEMFRRNLEETYPGIEHFTSSQLHNAAVNYQVSAKDIDLSRLLDVIKPYAKKERKYRTYIMRDGNTGYYKIGRSSKPEFREKTLQSENPTIDLLMIFENDVEGELHNMYKRKRVRGEWFALTNDDLIDIYTNHKVMCQNTNK